MGKIRISCSQLSSVSWIYLDLTYFLCLCMSHTLPTIQTRLPAGKSKGYLTNRSYSCPHSCFPRLWIQFSVQKPCPAEKEIRFSCLPGIRLPVFYPSQGSCCRPNRRGTQQCICRSLVQDMHRVKAHMLTSLQEILGREMESCPQPCPKGQGLALLQSLTNRWPLSDAPEGKCKLIKTWVHTDNI